MFKKGKGSVSETALVALCAAKEIAGGITAEMLARQDYPAGWTLSCMPIRLSEWDWLRDTGDPEFERIAEVTLQYPVRTVVVEVKIQRPFGGLVWKPTHAYWYEPVRGGHSGMWFAEKAHYVCPNGDYDSESNYQPVSGGCPNCQTQMLYAEDIVQPNLPLISHEIHHEIRL